MNPVKTYYIDASAIIKLFVDEDGSQRMREYFRENAIYYTTSLCFAETLSALKAKHLYRKEINQRKYLSAYFNLIAHVKEKRIKIEQIDFTNLDTFREVREIIKKYSIDVSDAFQIYTLKKGILSIFDYESKPVLVTADSRLAEVALEEGLRAWDILNEQQPKEY